MTAFAALTAATALEAAEPGGVPNAVQGFFVNKDQPILIKSESLEYQNKAAVATFREHVNLTQGDTAMKSKVLVVYYEPEGSRSGTSGQPPAATSQIKWAEANGGVVVTRKDQTATGNRGVFDMRKNRITLIGNVVITQASASCAASG